PVVARDEVQPRRQVHLHLGRGADVLEVNRLKHVRGFASSASGSCRGCPASCRRRSRARGNRCPRMSTYTRGRGDGNLSVEAESAGEGWPPCRQACPARRRSFTRGGPRRGRGGSGGEDRGEGGTGSLHGVRSAP